MKKNILLMLTIIVLGVNLGIERSFAVNYTNTIAQMTAYITNQMASRNVQGMSIVLVDDQAVVWTTGFGNADREAGVAADADTVYHIGSCSKAFLGTAYMQLFDQGRVVLDAPLTNYMTEFSMLPRFTNSGPVTIRSMLNHHSGIPGDFFNGMFTSRIRNDYMEWFINCLQGNYPFAPVNERYSYCNSGFALLSEAVRRISGTDFATFTDNMIFSPLGMNASSFLPDKSAISNRMAAAYDLGGNRQPAEIVNCLGSGSMYSSVNDLSRYIQMIIADGRFEGRSLVSSNAIDVMITPPLTNPPLDVMDLPQGLGWDNADDYRFSYAGRVFWKDGATLYHCAFLGISRDLKLGVAVIQNTPGGLCDEVGAEALRWAILDKTGTHWPTNTFVPESSPVTNRAQEELDAFCGLYVDSEGYHKIEAGAGTLTLIHNANSQTPVIISNLVPRANGWFSPANSQEMQLAFTNLAGHDMLIKHEVNGAYESVEPVGEHYLPEPLSAAWRGRTNSVYRMVDMYPDDYFWTQRSAQTLRLWFKDGVLGTTWMMGAFVIEPRNNMAFQRGTYYRKGGAVQVNTINGFELLQYSSYRFLDEVAIPTLPVPAITNGSIPFANGTQWYWFTGRTNTTYRARISVTNQDYYIRITDREGIVLGAGTNGPADWTCASNGTYAIAVCATNVFSYSLSLTVCGIHQAQSDYDGDEKADPAFYDSASGLWRVALSSQGYFVQTASVGAQGCLEVSADYDGDGKTDPAVYETATGNLLALLSMQGYAMNSLPLGLSGSAPVIADYDGDSKADPSLCSAALGMMITMLSGSSYASVNIGMGGIGWVNASEDYDGDGRTDPAVFNSQSGQWYVRFSTQGYSPDSTGFADGIGGVPVSGDYDGDGKGDLAIYKAASGTWVIALSGSSYALTQFTGFGGVGIIARPGDYDGDGKADPALYDPVARIFYVLLSGSGYRTVNTPF